MEKYLKYLLADIGAAAENVPVATFGDDDEDEHFISLEEEEKSARRQALADRLGVRQEWFPPAARLKDDQMSRILEAMMYCLDVYGFIPHFPMGLPLQRKYEIMVSYLSHEVPILAHNPWQIDFCDYEPKTCPFGESFCQCKVYEQWLSRFETEEEALSAESLEALMNQQGIAGSFFDEDDDEEEDEDEDGFFVDDEEYDEDEEGYEMDEEDWEDDEGDDTFFFGFSDFEPGPDGDDGIWN
ncbi:MAG: hypothetical protein KDC66_14065 [Phaeodactylibacter sp.]|nr:hypothetical protein [Phaeodactylibacter sp.]MCB9276378.1 hypothetical protein [Lewinellaceae bacterium]